MERSRQENSNSLELFLYRVRFPASLEKLYRDYYFNRSLYLIRIALLLGVVLYASFGFLDLKMAPSSFSQIWFIRFAIVCPLFIVIFISSFMKIFSIVIDWAMALMTLVAGFGIIAMMAVVKESETSLLYYAGVMLVVMWGCTLVRLRFFYALMVCLAILTGFEYTSLILLKMHRHENTMTVFINNNFFILGSIVIGVIAAYLIDQTMRLNFLTQLMLENKQKDLEEERNELQYRNEQTREELLIAREIQQQLIPPEDPFDDIASLYIPMDLVGGDFFDYIHFREEKQWGIFISDVSGHGVSSSLITGMIKSVILQAGGERKNPAELMGHLNDMLMEMSGEKFVTAYYSIYDPATRKLLFTNAGHHPPMIIRGGEVLTMPYQSYFPLGVYSVKDLSTRDKAYGSQLYQLEAGDSVLFYTDGIAEISSTVDGNRKFFSEIMKETLLRIKSDTCRGFLDGLYKEIIAYNGSNAFDDDICLIYMKIT